MKINILLLWLLLLSTSIMPLAAQPESQYIPASKTEVSDLIKKVNNYWQATNPTHGNAFWHNASYHTGNIEAYKITGVEAYKNYSEAWANRNNWMGATQSDKTRWRYASYSESNDWVMFGDWQIAFQVYIDLYNLDAVKDPQKIARAREVMEYQMSLPHVDYWWWADGLYMVMPVMTRLYKVTGNQLYLDKLHQYLSYSNSIMYDAEAKLYYRDAKYIFPNWKTSSGKKDFWARGDGWVFAGFARVLQDLPETNAHRNEYVQLFKGMAQAIAASQQPEGYWSRSMLDAAHAPGYETSGTAFFTFGLLWGINNGLLDKETYLPVAAKAWHYLTTIALHESGKIGYVQPIGEQAVPGMEVGYQSTERFGVGAFLLAASEMYRYVASTENVTGAKQDAVTEQLAVYPNPATTTANVLVPAGVRCQGIEVKDAQGKTVASRRGELAGEVTLALEHLPKGLYFIRLHTGRSIYTKKLVLN